MRRDLFLYFGIAYALTWVSVAPLVAAHQGIIGSVPEFWHALGALGPIGAALLVARSAERARLVKSTFLKLPPRPWLWVAAGSPLLLFAVATAIVSLVRPGELDFGTLREAFHSPFWWSQLAIAALVYGFGEEPGWRGFALPRLQASFPAWKATLLLGVLWAFWHTPMFFYRFDFEGPETLIGFFLSLVAGAFWLTFLYNSSGGSVMSVAVWHAVWNAANLVAATMSLSLVAWLNGLMMVLGYAVLLSGPRRLSFSGEAVTPTPVPDS